MKTSGLIVTLALAVTACVPGGGADERSKQAHQAVQAGAVLLDVRTPQEFAAGHLDGAVNIPVQELEQRLGELPAKDRQYVIYCHSGRRSAIAKRMLESRGYTQLLDLGAMTNW